MLRIKDVKIKKDFSKEELIRYICEKSRIKLTDVRDFRIYKKSIDARNKVDIFYVYTVDILVEDEKLYNKFEHIDLEDEAKIDVKINRKSVLRPIIVGAGPAGLFAALTLAQNGIKPIVLEQGKSVDERQKDVELFWKEGKLNILSNVQFGEGGAGTFSDGKLTTGVNDPLCKKVIREFYNFGAPEQILYTSKPHIGTDNLINIVRNMREEIKRLGGDVYFNEQVVDFKIEDNKIKEVICKSGKVFETDTLVLAIGHSARATFEKLYSKGISMEKKNFSVGVRIEHKQEMINKSQYGDKTKLKLPPAEYKLAYHGEDRSCYTFCMCPGGVVVASSSEEGTIVTNGMSKFARDGENANSAVLVSVIPEDFPGDSPLLGMYFQKQLEEKAFEIGGENYKAPVQLVGDFLNHKKSEAFGDVKPTYMPGVQFAELHDVLPEFITKTMEEGLVYFDKKIKGFASKDAILTGVETRSSSPVKILRDEKCEANVEGIYPCGEGAGYAGGIVTAAVDGIKCAIAICEKE